MCGIAGIVARGPVNPAALTEMIARIAHRGPDGDGVWVNADRTVGLAIAVSP